MNTDDYVKSEKELGALLGWTNFHERVGIYSKSDIIIKATPPVSDPIPYFRIMPAWVRSWSACGPLMAQYDVYPTSIYESGKIIGIKTFWCTFEFKYFNGDADMATRHAIVIEAIMKLRALQPGFHGEDTIM